MSFILKRTKSSILYIPPNVNIHFRRISCLKKENRSNIKKVRFNPVLFEERFFDKTKPMKKYLRTKIREVGYLSPCERRKIQKEQFQKLHYVSIIQRFFHQFFNKTKWVYQGNITIAPPTPPKKEWD